MSDEKVVKHNESLMTLLRLLGREWGPLGVALAAAELTDTDVLVEQLGATSPVWDTVRAGDLTAERLGLAVVVHPTAEAAQYGHYRRATRPVLVAVRHEARGVCLTTTYGTPPSLSDVGSFANVTVAPNHRVLVERRQPQIGRPRG